MTEFFVDGERSLPPLPHQREASWTAVVLYRFLVGQSIPVNRAGWKPKRWNPLTGTVRASAIRLRGGNILVSFHRSWKRAGRDSLASLKTLSARPV